MAKSQHAIEREIQRVNDDILNEKITKYNCAIEGCESVMFITNGVPMYVYCSEHRPFMPYRVYDKAPQQRRSMIYTIERPPERLTQRINRHDLMAALRS